MKLKAGDIFILPESKIEFTWKELLSLPLNMKGISSIQSQLNLVYQRDRENTCLANSSEVRHEFRTSFTKSELITYIFSLASKNTINTHQTEIFFPNNSDDFWLLVNSGN
ncbi:MAG: hypothetical protein KDD63_00920 [Bacteroidetes bacterium]|nr:hypothetical protein [Bacteroidota bacterium]MCB0841980.1 hypothetical protein [Bacteroidota bacterium]MCB0850774.1 hypothetical protein [Bacteroidota bacterium]